MVGYMRILSAKRMFSSERRRAEREGGSKLFRFGEFQRYQRERRGELACEEGEMMLADRKIKEWF